MGRNRVLLAVVGLIVSAGLCGGAFAGEVWLCSINDAVEVDEDGTSGPPDLQGLARPTFIRVDPGSKEITILAPEARRGEVTKIDAVHQHEGQWVFSGVEENRAWSMVISPTGHMTLSVTSDGVTWSVFGHALKQNE